MMGDACRGRPARVGRVRRDPAQRASAAAALADALVRLREERGCATMEDLTGCGWTAEAVRTLGPEALRIAIHRAHQAGRAW